MAAKKSKKKPAKKKAKRSVSKNGGMTAILKKLTKSNLQKVPTKQLESASKQLVKAAVVADVILDERGYNPPPIGERPYSSVWFKKGHLVRET